MSMTKGTSGYISPKIIVENYSGFFHVTDGRSKVKKYGTGYPELAIKEALDSLDASRLTDGHQQKVLLKGNFPNFDFPSGNGGCIDLYPLTALELQGSVTLADGVNKPIIKNGSTAEVTKPDGSVGQWVDIIGGNWSGNRAGQTETDPLKCSGFEIVFGELTHARWNIRHVDLRRTRGHGIYQKYANLVKVYDARLRVADDWGDILDASMLYIDFSWDCFFSRITGNARRHCVYINNSGGNHFNDLYLGGGRTGIFVNVGGYEDFFHNIRMDEISQHGIYHENANYGFRRCIFSDILITDIGLTETNTYDGIHLNTSSSGAADINTDNIFSNILINNEGKTEKPRYGINEVAGKADYNIFGFINGRDCATAALKKTGSHSEAAHIIGTVV
ncbi:hypothetical protein ES702_03983 [subsurface metagenome]